MSRASLALAVSLLALASSACTLGPRGVVPPVALPPVTAPQTFAPLNGPAQVVTVAPVPAEWWRSFGNTDIDTLVAEAQGRS